MKKTLIELEARIHSLQLSTNDNRDKFIFQICRELVFDKLKLIEISDEEIEKQALTFAKEESYGSLSTDLWKGYVFGAQWYREQLKKK